MFTPEQIQALEAPLDARHVKKTQGNDYIEGWHAIAEANRVFGFDGWCRETAELYPVADGNHKGKDFVQYVAKVRVTVYAGERTITREGTGYGSGYGLDRHEGAAKEAETDAMKRAMMTFGNPFGLALYDKEKRHVEHNPKPRQNGQRKQKAQPDLLTAEEAQRLHIGLSKMDYPQKSARYELASFVAGREITSLTQITHDEARAVWNMARALWQNVPLDGEEVQA